MDKRAYTTVAVFGASGLIGQAVAEGLARSAISVVPIARRFSGTQRHIFGPAAITCPIVETDVDVLSRIIAERRVDVIVNCVGVLQGRGRGGTDAVHRRLAQHLIAAIEANNEPILLVQISIPGSLEHDETPFSRSKRTAEQLIAAASIPFAIVRPAFVIAPGAYGGSALLRALAALPFDLPRLEAGRPLATTDVDDIVQTVAIVVRRWRNGEENWNAVWDVMSPQSTTAGDVLDALRMHFGGPNRRWCLPSGLLRLGAVAGDVVAYFGWNPPLRTTALKELRRGVEGNPSQWVAETGIKPVSLKSALQRLPATVQEKWFARIYLAKALVLASLVLFWIASGLIGLAAINAAAEILTSHGFSTGAARGVSLAGCLADVVIGCAIALRRTCRVGLVAGVGLAFGYMMAAAVVAPELWAEPLGALVKTVPIMVLMVVALAILENR